MKRAWLENGTVSRLFRLPPWNLTKPLIFCGNRPGSRVFLPDISERISKMLGTILIVVLLLLLLGAWPSWPHSQAWGYYPSGTLGLVLVIVLVLALMGRL
jgi:hypothetical protein